MSYEGIDDAGRIVQLRKRKRCEWCDQWIEKGEHAVARTYKFEDTLISSRMHPECFAAMERCISIMWDNSFEPGEQGRGCNFEYFEQDNKK